MPRGNIKTPENRKGYKGKKISVFFEKVRARRLELGLDQKDVAAALGVVPSRISELEGGKFFDDPDRIIDLCKALEIDANYLFGMDAMEE